MGLPLVGEVQSQGITGSGKSQGITRSGNLGLGQRNFEFLENTGKFRKIPFKYLTFNAVVPQTQMSYAIYTIILWNQLYSYKARHIAI